MSTEIRYQTRSLHRFRMQLHQLTPQELDSRQNSGTSTNTAQPIEPLDIDLSFASLHHAPV